MKNLILILVFFALASFISLAQDKPQFDPDSFKNFPESTIIEINVSGDHGKNGKSGYSYSGRADDYHAGRNGGDATLSTPGESAGNMNIDLSLSDPENPKWFRGIPFDANVVLKGIVEQASGRTQRIRKNLKYRLNAIIKLFAMGGYGGHGGHGGNGERGGRGYPGRDATFHIPGERGFPGMPGGSNGLASDGSHGGSGGKIIVRVPHDQTQLLYALGYNVSGGKGGSAGDHGRVGAGGPGGYGGDSFTWIEETVEEYIDQNGERQTRTVRKTIVEPAGDQGPSGKAGRKRRRTRYNGGDGYNGSIEYHVVQADGSVEVFNKVYDVELVGFDVVEHDGNKIIEPGEKITVKNIVVRNTGGMPLPKKRRVHIFIKNSDWVTSEPVTLEIPASLKPGQTYEFKNQTLSFQVNNTKAQHIGEAPFETKGQISPKAIQSGTLTLMDNFGGAKNFEVSYPVQVTPITALRSIEPGTGSRIFWEVKNISNKKIGSLADIKRELNTKLFGDIESVGKENIVFFDKNNKAIDIEKGFLEAVAGLEPGETRMIEGVIGFKNEAPMNEKVNLNLDLNLETKANGVQTIQRPLFKIGVTETFKKTPGSNFLLIVNNETDIETINKFKSLAASIDQKIDIWDLSHYGMLDLSKQIAANNKSIMELFENKTVLLLNNDFKSNQGSEVNSLGLLSKTQFAQALSEHGVNFVAISEDGKTGNPYSDLLMPTNDVQVEEVKFEDFIKLISVDGIEGEAKGLNQIGYVVDSQKLKFFSTPSRSELEAKATKLNKKLLSQLPERNYVSVVDFQPRVVKTWLWGAIKKYDLGEITLRQTGEKGRAKSIELKINDFGEIKSGEFFRTKRSLFSILIGMSFEEKLDVIYDFVSKAENAEALRDRTLRKVLTDVILFDLVTEQVEQRLHFWKQMNRADVASKLEKLQILANKKLPFTLMPTGVQRYFYAELFGKLRAFLQAQNSWYSYILPGNSQMNVSLASMKLVKQWLKTNISKLPKESRVSFNEKVKIAKEVEYEKYTWLADKKDIKVKESSKKHYLDKELAGNNPEAKNKLLSRYKYEDMAKKDVAAKKALEEFLKLEKDELAKLKVKLDCDNNYLPIK